MAADCVRFRSTTFSKFRNLSRTIGLRWTRRSRLTQEDERKGQVVELRFLGLSVEETADVLGFRPTPSCAIGALPKPG